MAAKIGNFRGNCRILSPKYSQKTFFKERHLSLKEVAFIAGTSENPADQKTFYYFFH